MDGASRALFNQGASSVAYVRKYVRYVSAHGVGRGAFVGRSSTGPVAFTRLLTRAHTRARVCLAKAWRLFRECDLFPQVAMGLRLLEASCRFLQLLLPPMLKRLYSTYHIVSLLFPRCVVCCPT